MQTTATTSPTPVSATAAADNSSPAIVTDLTLGNNPRADPCPTETETDTVNLLSRADESTVTVGACPLGDDGPNLVLLRVQTPLSETAAASYLAPDDALALAAALSSAAVHSADGRHVISVGEGMTTEEIGRLLDTLPPGSSLADFSCDTTACLVFTCPSPIADAQMATALG